MRVKGTPVPFMDSGRLLARLDGLRCENAALVKSWGMR